MLRPFFVTGTQLALSCNVVLSILKNKAFHVEIFFLVLKFSLRWFFCLRIMYLELLYLELLLKLVCLFFSYLREGLSYCEQCEAESGRISW